ncbi:MAG: Uncharacterised protein [Cryomorphaceae bacterium]|nr:MAG: Uncharacterised protein [Cryomorphaceae bacterium]
MTSSPGIVISLNILDFNLSISALSISISILSLTNSPLCCKLFICCPAIPTKTSSISIPDFFFASQIASFIESTVLSILATIPLATPLETALPVPNISNFSY